MVFYVRMHGLEFVLHASSMEITKVHLAFCSSAEMSYI